MKLANIATGFLLQVLQYHCPSLLESLPHIVITCRFALKDLSRMLQPFPCGKNGLLLHWTTHSSLLILPKRIIKLSSLCRYLLIGGPDSFYEVCLCDRSTGHPFRLFLRYCYSYRCYRSIRLPLLFQCLRDLDFQVSDIILSLFSSIRQPSTQTHNVIII